MHDSGRLARNLRGGAARLWERLPWLSADALLPRVWGSERVSEGGVLRNAVKKLRRQMGDDGAAPGCIITEPRVGGGSYSGGEESVVWFPKGVSIMGSAEYDTSGVDQGVTPAYVPIEETSHWWESLGRWAEVARIGGAVVLPSGEVMLVRHPRDAKVLGGWFAQTLDACVNLRTSPSDLPYENARLTDFGAVMRLLSLLGKILDDDCPAPAMVPTDLGGVQAEWHRNGLNLEIESDPDGGLEYYASGRGHEYEGPVLDDDLAELRECARLLGEPSSVSVA